ncbi:hypothetical protein BST29_08945 [Mycobacterium malmoense]|uniref:Uncharacterized protein n=2 Tax=Mycobacterium malmoense TaxID=1780 RepID=A0ABX3ST67_MYCMA|nr:hypothetical protein BMG05_20680 [Mycobacterium malmoense]ORA83657.1 hypothetical protein BST29_08945 [Mycobacterium malmoense]
MMALDTHEAKRRGDESLESVPSLAMLDVLLGLPLGCPIDVEDLTEHEVRMLRTAPHGCVEFTDTTVTRRLQVPTTVVAAVVRGTRWRTSLLRAAAFSAFTQRIVALKSPPRAAAVLEAQVVGVGIWVEREAGSFEELLAPEPFIPRYFKAAGWRFAENAYKAATEARTLSHDHTLGRASARCYCC